MSKSHTIQNLVLPKELKTRSLYIKGSFDENHNFHQPILLKSEISFDTYFNSFYLNYWLRYTQVYDFFYSFFFTGDVCVELYQEDALNNKKLLIKENFIKCISTTPNTLHFNIDKKKDKHTRLYVVIKPINNQSKSFFISGALKTHAHYKYNAIKIGIVMCSFKREHYVKNTVQEIYSNSYLHDKIMTYIVDNGRTLLASNFAQYPNLQIIPNKNLGGSGGFTRGMMEVKHNPLLTHILLMDDDISLDAEVIYRTILFLRYANPEVVIAGTMLDKHLGTFQYESGANFNKYFIGYKPKYRNLNMTLSSNLNKMTVNNKFDYGGWWYLVFSKEQLTDTGYSLPFFLLGDDSEHCLRLKKVNNAKLITPPGIAVWHDPFYAKKQTWLRYYFTRNLVHVNLIHFRTSIYYKIFSLARNFFQSIYLFEYDSAMYTIKAMQDILKGPNFFNNIDHENFHLKLIKTPSITTTKISNNNNNATYRKPNIFLTLLSLITLNGHLLPSFLLSNKEHTLFIKQNGQSFYKRFLILSSSVGYKYVREKIPLSSNFEVKKISHKTFFKLCFKFIFFFIILFIQIPILKLQWHFKIRHFVSENYWKKQF